MSAIMNFLIVLCLIAVAHAGIIPTQHVIHEPVLAKVGHVVHTLPSAVAHQSITQVHHGKTILQPVIAPVAVKTTTVHDAPAVLHTYPVVQHIAPVVHHAGPVLKTYVAAPSISYAVQSHH